MFETKHRKWLAAWAIIATAASAARAGDLNPPAGPVAPTHKTLTEVEPRIAVNATNTPGDANYMFIISQPGSYYLTGNAVGEAGKSGVRISVANVTLDLMGYAIIGVPGTFSGVVTLASPVVIRNGIIRDWDAAGIQGNTLIFSKIDSILTASNGQNGMVVNTGCLVTNCVATENGLAGFGSAARCSFIDCIATFNTGAGFQAATGSLVSACIASDNDGDGINASNSLTITGCTAQANILNGISAGQGCTITNNNASFNSLDGIRASDDCLIQANACDSNGNLGDGAGIHTMGSDNRIEANNVSDSDRGIDVDAAGNVIIRNSASGNTINYSVAASNVGFYVSATTTGAVSGSSGGTTIGTTDPWANLSY